MRVRLKKRGIQINFILLFLCVVSIIYCCDIPVWTGFELFINNHDSMLYGIGLSIAAAYIFFIFQTLLPEYIHYNRTRKIGCLKLREIEDSMLKILRYLQGEITWPADKITEESIGNYLKKIDIFTYGCKYEIHDHKELSIFEVITYHDEKIMRLTDEILSNRYLEAKYEQLLFKLKLSKFHEIVERWSDNCPGEYIRCNQGDKSGLATGYNWVNNQVVSEDFVSSIGDFIEIYKKINRMEEKLYQKLF